MCMALKAALELAAAAALPEHGVVVNVDVLERLVRRRRTSAASLCIGERAAPRSVKKCSCHSCRNILVLRLRISPWYEMAAAVMSTCGLFVGDGGEAVPPMFDSLLMRSQWLVRRTGGAGAAVAVVVVAVASGGCCGLAGDGRDGHLERRALGSGVQGIAHEAVPGEGRKAGALVRRSAWAPGWWPASKMEFSSSVGMTGNEGRRMAGVARHGAGRCRVVAAEVPVSGGTDCEKPRETGGSSVTVIGTSISEKGGAEAVRRGRGRLVLG